MRARAYRGCTVGGVGGDQRRVERRRAMAAAVELGRAATMASVRAAGDDVARPLSALHHATEPPRKRWTCMQMKSLDLKLGPAHVHSWNELAESSLEPCGTPAGSKGSPRPGGRTVAGARGAFKKIPGTGKGLRTLHALCVSMSSLLPHQPRFCNFVGSVATPLRPHHQ